MPSTNENLKLWTSKDVIKILGIIFWVLGFLILFTFLIKPKITYASFIINGGLFLVTLGTFVFFLKKKKISWEEFGFGKISLNWVFFSLLLSFVIVFAGGFLSKVFSNLIGIESVGSFSKDVFGNNNLWLNLLNFKIIVPFVVPFTEELIFRGLIFKFIRQERSFIFSAVISSLLFSTMHLDLSSLPFTFLLGFATCFALEKSKSMIYPFLIHMGVNELAANMVFLSIL